VAEEVSSNLDRRLFELLLTISRCLNNMEEMLNTSVLSTEEAAVQQVLYEVTVLKHPGKEKPPWISVTTEYIWPDVSSLVCWCCSGITAPSCLVLDQSGPMALTTITSLSPAAVYRQESLDRDHFHSCYPSFNPLDFFCGAAKTSH